MHVVATAGHVDHGKSTLVRLLTGMEPDRWAEERRRGMTIDLGFAWTVLPSGEQVAFVDVPGHERFVANMLAGVGPAPAAMLVVAADEGWMPQSEEHLAALDALDVRHGLLVVSRADLADPAPALAQARARLARSSLAPADSVVVSATTGQGVDVLRDALDRLVSRLPPPRRDAAVRMWVDRAFTVRGAGTVVTGTLPAGTVRVGDALVLARTAAVVRVRALESLRQRRHEVGAVARVAVNLRGVDVTDVRRGDALLTPGSATLTDVVDVRVSEVPGHTQLVLHVGSAAVAAHVRPLGGDLVRLRLAAPLPLRAADRALLRDPGRHLVVAGVTVLDVAPPPLTRRGAGPARSRELADVRAPDPDDEVRRRGMLRRRQLVEMGVAGEPQQAVAAGEWWVAEHAWTRLQRRLEQVVAEHDAEHPLDPGIAPEAARVLLGLDDVALVEALAATVAQLETARGRILRRGSAPVLPARVEQALSSVLDRLADAPFVAPEAPDLAALGLGTREIAAASRAGRILRLGDVVLAPGADDEAVRRLAQLPQPFTTSQAREALGTTRRVAIPLLEHLDAQRRTRRVDATRRVVLR